MTRCRQHREAQACVRVSIAQHVIDLEIGVGASCASHVPTRRVRSFSTSRRCGSRQRRLVTGDVGNGDMAKGMGMGR